MEITRTSILTGKTRTLNIPCTSKQLHKWKSGTPIQRAMPNVRESDREFIISGITPEEWNEILADPGDEV